MTPTDQWHTRNVVWSDQQTCVGLILPINAPNEIRTSARFAGKLLYAPPLQSHLCTQWDSSRFFNDLFGVSPSPQTNEHFDSPWPIPRKFAVQHSYVAALPRCRSRTPRWLLGSAGGRPQRRSCRSRSRIGPPY